MPHPTTFESMISNRRNQIYWLSQFIGWGLFVFGNILSASIQGSGIRGVYLISLCIFVVGILTTHAFRLLVNKWRWTTLSIPRLIPRILLAAIICSATFVAINTAFTNILISHSGVFNNLFTISFWVNTLNFSALFLLWNIIYFAVHVFENWKREEIVNLELKATQTEIELNSFKAQMNPHFMFNSLNSIRALIDEDPAKAKYAITSLSGILRNNLTLGKSQTIPLSEELDLVEKYLSLEKIRFEDRLNYRINVAPGALSYHIPPFMLQTIVENGIKHGISKLIAGGVLEVDAIVEDDILKIKVLNSGEYIPPDQRQDGREGIGIVNSHKRLQLLYGDKSYLKIQSLEDAVQVELAIPNTK
jgi:two-component system LytT family sensor kinase